MQQDWAARLGQLGDIDALTVDEFISRMPPQLRQYWLTGPGAARIRWCTPGSFERARRALRPHVPRRMLNGLVANLYREACGRWPGQRRD